MSKYLNKPIVTPDGERFDSNAEMSRYLVLQNWQRLGKISELQRQVPFVLSPAVLIKGRPRKSPALRYYADFVYRDSDGVLVVEDVKGKITEGYRIKRHILAVQGITITEIRHD